MKVEETHVARVVNVDDPEKRGRIKVACASLLGDETQSLPQWIEMVPTWGWFTIPDVGETVDIELSTGSDNDEAPEQTSITAGDIKYRPNRYFGGTETDTPTPVHDDFTSKNYGKRRGFATPKGHIVLFDDTDGDERLSWTWTNGKGKFAYHGIDKNGSMVMGNANGSLISMDVKNEQTAIIDQFGNSIIQDATGMRFLDKNGNAVAMGDGSMSLMADAVTVTCKNLLLDAGKIDLADDGERVILGDTFLDLFANHNHMGFMGPTGPAQPGAGGDTAPWEIALSEKVSLG